MQYLDTGSRNPQQSLAKWLQKVLSEDVDEIRLQSGYFTLDSMGLFVPTLTKSAANNRLVRILVGSNNGRTLRDHVAGLIELIGIPRSKAQLGIVNFAGALFHPKAYHIRLVDGTQTAFVGSANLTAAGLALHIEAGVALDTREGDPAEKVSQIAAAIDQWFDENRPGLIPVNNQDVLNELVTSGVLSLGPPPSPPKASEPTPPPIHPSRPRLKALADVPGIQIGETPAEMVPTTPGAEPEPSIGISAPKAGFPDYILFDTTTSWPTVGPYALTGSQLPGGAVGLILQLNKDSARHFAGFGGTANISIPIAAVGTLRFGTFGKYERPRAEYDLHLRYLGEGVVILGETAGTNVMAYGYSRGEPGHRDIRMLVPHEVVGLAQAIQAQGLPVPAAGHLALLEWPNQRDPSFRLTFLQHGSSLANTASLIFGSAMELRHIVGKGACWLRSGLSPAW